MRQARTILCEATKEATGTQGFVFFKYCEARWISNILSDGVSVAVARAVSTGRVAAARLHSSPVA